MPTLKVNGVAIAREKQRMGLGTHCKYGHLRTPETTGTNRYGFLICLLCKHHSEATGKPGIVQNPVKL